MAAWSRKTCKFCEHFLFFFEKRRLMVKFSKFCSESLHGDTNRRVERSNVVKFVWREIGEVMRYLHDKQISAASQTVAIAAIAPKIYQNQPATMCLQCYRIFIQIGSLSAEL